MNVEICIGKVATLWSQTNFFSSLKMENHSLDKLYEFYDEELSDQIDSDREFLIASVFSWVICQYINFNVQTKNRVVRMSTVKLRNLLPFIENHIKDLTLKPEIDELLSFVSTNKYRLLIDFVDC